MNTLINGAAKIKENIDRPLSIINKSALIKLISFPEFVSVILFIENCTTLSKSAAHNVLLNLREIYTPSKIYLFLNNWAIIIAIINLKSTLTPSYIYYDNSKYPNIFIFSKDSISDFKKIIKPPTKKL